MHPSPGPLLVVALALAALLAEAAPARGRRPARPDAGLPAAPAAPDTGSLAAARPCANVELPPPAAPGPSAGARRWTDPGEEPPWDGGSCELTGRVTLVPAPGARPPAGVVVFLEGVPAGQFPRQAPSHHQVRQRDRQFVPPLLVVQRHDTVEFWNDDQEEHQVYSSDRGESFDIPSTTRSLSGSHRFRTVGSVRLQCNLHPWMRADIRIVDSPHWTVVQSDGTWRLRVPEGTRTVVAWEPNGGRVQRQLDVCGGAAVELRLEQAEEPVRRRKGGPVSPEYSQ